MNIETLIIPQVLSVFLSFLNRPFFASIHLVKLLFCRPYIPILFPGHDIYIWCDADTWVQKISSLRTYRDAVLANSSHIAISPLIDTTYQFYYTDCTEFAGYNHNWYSEAYGRDIAKTQSSKAVLSAGVFGMHVSNPIWRAWSVEIETVFRRQYTEQVVQHLAEQTALNYLIYSYKQYTPLEAIHNYNCHIGCAVRRNGRVVLNNFPFREVGIIHLTLSGRKMKEYIESGLLYQEGKYLSADELNKLATVAHY